MRGPCPFVKLKVFPEHAQQVLFKPHHQRMHPGVEQNIRAFKSHLGRVACREILHMHWRRNNRARNAKPLGNMPLHLRTKNQVGLGLANGLLHLKVVF